MTLPEYLMIGLFVSSLFLLITTIFHKEGGGDKLVVSGLVGCIFLGILMAVMAITGYPIWTW